MSRQHVDDAIPAGAASDRLPARHGGNDIRIMTWGGRRGGISVALALSRPNLQGRAALLAATHGVVLFSILVQALTMRPLLRKLMPRNRNGG